MISTLRTLWLLPGRDLAVLSVSVCHYKGCVSAHTLCRRNTTCRKLKSFVWSPVCPSRKCSLPPCDSFCLQCITFSLIHGSRWRMSHVIVVAVGSVQLLLPSSSSQFHHFFSFSITSSQPSFLLLLAAFRVVVVRVSSC